MVNHFVVHLKLTQQLYSNIKSFIKKYAVASKRLTLSYAIVISLKLMIINLQAILW